MLLRGRVPGAMVHQSPGPVLKESSGGGVLKWQPCVLKLVCGCNNFVFLRARSLYSVAWVLPGRCCCWGSGLCLLFVCLWKGLKREKDYTFITMF